MRGPSLAMVSAVSLAAHMGVLAAIAYEGHFRRDPVEIVYTVNLEEISSPKDQAAETPPPSRPQAPAKPKEATALMPAMKQAAKKTSMVNTPSAETKYLEDAKAVLAAKKRVEGKVKARASSSGSSGGKVEAFKKTSETLAEQYSKKLRAAIERQWYYPSTEGKPLEAVFRISVARNGEIKSAQLSKSSGNSLFDDSAERIFKRISPYEPPPFEMEIEVRFTDSEKR